MRLLHFNKKSVSFGGIEQAGNNYGRKIKAGTVQSGAWSCAKFCLSEKEGQEKQ